MDISRRERVLARKNTDALFSGSLEEIAADIENVAMLLVSQELNIPPVCTTSELSMSRMRLLIGLPTNESVGGDYHQDLHLIMAHFGLILVDLSIILHHFVVLFLVLYLSRLYILFVKGRRRRMMQLMFKENHLFGSRWRVSFDQRYWYIFCIDH